ncbi:MAG: SAM-dependent methyltransferase [Micavibrio aeruginosavorus]|uniref:SAM-dependent methyltransferase n=1 Tax=Micavibrio aeruginosavorus TaxID=349221 RepID=A0A7T5R1D0_9BACT|nr:MAG: SAM-dependent methyltransferase [Micavibrio aeruginosavorus]
MNRLEEKIRHAIGLNGPMKLETFMTLAVGDYYANCDPFGAAGDFITSPDISQMFGELIGIWVADTWIKLGRPDQFQLVEGGPGRGTLMADILRATQRVDGLHQAAQIHLIETSRRLRECQEEILQDYQVFWHDDLDSLPALPVIFIANELLDAFPIRQIECRNGQWHERVIGIEDGNLTFGLIPVDIDLPVAEGAIKEFCPQALSFVNRLANLIGQQKGAALLIDYGYDDPMHVGDTLQAVKNHQFASVLDTPGESDLTALVDFHTLRGYLPGMNLFGPITQREFLMNMGINLRLEKLKAIATPEQKMDLQSGYVRLTAADQMGTLFKVMAFCHDPAMKLGGF